MNATRTETSHFLAELLFRDISRKKRLLLLFVIGIANDSFFPALLNRNSYKLCETK